MADWSSVVSSMSGHPRSHDKYIQYGTAGFRCKAELLDHVMFRMGLLATLRSQVKGGQAIGVMITASHNPGPDNGVKLVDPAGEMLEQEWEAVATRLANCPDDQVTSELDQIVAKYNIARSGPSLVIVGRDTRVSSPALAQAWKLRRVEGVGTRAQALPATAHLLRTVPLRANGLTPFSWRTAGSCCWRRPAGDSCPGPALPCSWSRTVWE